MDKEGQNTVDSFSSLFKSILFLKGKILFKIDLCQLHGTQNSRKLQNTQGSTLQICKA